jgi:hypothetical protein
MDLDRILNTFNKHQVGCLLIGGMNFLLRHDPVLTFDVDLWIEDTPENRERTEDALAELDAQWGLSEQDWKPVAQHRRGWLSRQGVYCLTSAVGAIDIFRTVQGLASWRECRSAAGRRTGDCRMPTCSMCQLALPEPQRRQDRIRTPKAAIEQERR